MRAVTVCRRGWAPPLAELRLDLSENVTGSARGVVRLSGHPGTALSLNRLTAAHVEDRTVARPFDDRKVPRESAHPRLRRGFGLVDDEEAHLGEIDP
jgi:hypothetical protein